MPTMQNNNAFMNIFMQESIFTPFGNWQYSPNGRGPCRVVTGVWNALSHQGKDDEASHVALAFTGINGDLCW